MREVCWQLDFFGKSSNFVPLSKSRKSFVEVLVSKILGRGRREVVAALGSSGLDALPGESGGGRRCEGRSRVSVRLAVALLSYRRHLTVHVLDYGLVLFDLVFFILND